MRQKVLADAVGTTQSTISMIETCQRYLDVAELLVLAAAVSADPWKLMRQAMRESPLALPPAIKPASRPPAKRQARKPAKAK